MGIGNRPPIFKACARKFVFRKKKCLQKASSGGNSVEGGKFGCGKGVFALPHKCVFPKVFGGARKSATRNAKKKKRRLLLLQTLQTLISYRRFSEQNHDIMSNFFVGKNKLGASKNSETPQNGWFIRENPYQKWMIWGKKTLFLVQHPNINPGICYHYITSSSPIATTWIART